MLLDAILAATPDRRTDLLTSDRGWQSFSGGELPTGTSSGVKVDEGSALSFSAVWAAVTTLASLFASLPFHTYRRLPDDGREIDRAHSVYDLLRLRPNPFMSSFVWREALEGHKLLWGNAYSEIVYDTSGTIRELWPIIPERVRIEAEGAGYIYIVTNPDNEEVRIPVWKMLHVPGFSADGILGSSPVRVNRDTIGGALASEQYSGGFFAHGVNPTGILTWPGLQDKDEEKRKAGKRLFEESHGGLSRAHRVLMMSEAGDWKQISTDPEKSQLLETRQFGVNQMSRVFPIPGFLLGDNEAMKWRNVEQMTLVFQKFSLAPTVTRYEQEFNYKLFPGGERQTHFAELDMDGLLRADVETRTAGYHSGFQVGLWTINEMLKREGRNGIGPPGDVRFVPMNLTPVEQAIEPAAPPPAPFPPPQRSEEETEAQRKLITTLVSRAIEIERHELCKARARLADKGDAAWFDRWATKFYQGHETRMSDAMLPGMQMAAVSEGIPLPVVNAWVEARAASYVNSSLMARARDETYDPAGLNPAVEATAIYEAFAEELGNEPNGTI